MRLSDGREELARCRHFVTESVSMPAGERHAPAAERSQLWICLEGRGTIGGEAFGPREVWLLADEGQPPEIRASEGTRFLRTYAPRESAG